MPYLMKDSSVVWRHSVLEEKDALRHYDIVTVTRVGYVRADSGASSRYIFLRASDTRRYFV